MAFNEVSAFSGTINVPGSIEATVVAPIPLRVLTVSELGGTSAARYSGAAGGAGGESQSRLIYDTVTLA